tara:strand:+ start:14173 stop:14964 length:792 start_codon:yes stop_codon:yes gene_type:complete
LVNEKETSKGIGVFMVTVITLIAVYIGLQFGIPWLAVLAGLSQTPAPLPGFALGIYMACALAGTLFYMSSEEERWRSFLSPIIGLFDVSSSGPGRTQLLVLILIPLTVGWAAWRILIPGSQTPTVIRVQHPGLPEKFAEIDNPYAGVSKEEREVLEREGVVLFQKNCRPCHGTMADGEGPLARGQRLRPVDFTDPGTIATVVESYPFWRISEGAAGLPSIATPWNSAMPSWSEELNDEDIWRIVMAAYRLSGTEPRLPEKLEP